MPEQNFPTTDARTTPPQLRNQKRAKFALEKVQSLPNEEAVKRAYRALVESFPTEVRSLGAGQAVALLLSRCEEAKPEPKPQHRAARLLRDALTCWLTQESALSSVSGASLIARLTNAERNAYLQTQEEMLLFYGWLKTFAQAFLPSG